MNVTAVVVEKVLGFKKNMALYFKNVDSTFIHIPKTGGTMMREWTKVHIRRNAAEGVCSKYPDSVVNRHAKLNEIKKVWPDPGNVFVFVRNPYARLVSLFHWVGQAAKRRLQEKYEYHLEKFIIYDILETRSYDNGFDRYVRKLYNKEYSEIWFDKWRYENGWTRADTQSSWIEGGKADIIKLEEIKEKFSIVQDLTGCKAPFLSEVHNASQHDHYSTYYTPETKLMVAEMFYEDFKQFGYDI
jgi:hypothetical protein